MRPKRRLASAMQAASVASLVTSACQGAHSPVPPSCATMAAVSSADASRLSTASTFAPSCAKRSTVARPLPIPSPGDCPAPMTTATLFLRRIRKSHAQADGRSAIRGAACAIVHSTSDFSRFHFFAASQSLIRRARNRIRSSFDLFDLGPPTSRTPRILARSIPRSALGSGLMSPAPVGLTKSRGGASRSCRPAEWPKRCRGSDLGGW